jgi:hypothetical protein
MNRIKKTCCTSFCVLLISLVTHSVYAAQFKIKFINESSIAIAMSGVIEKGDFDTLKGIIEPNISVNTKLRLIGLNSNGGDVLTAMRIGRYIRQYDFDTHVGRTNNVEDRCLSSCVFIFAAGLERTAEDNIGIHRPFGTQTGSVQKNAAMDDYKKLKKDIFEYFDEMNISRYLPEQMMIIPPDEIKMLSMQEAMELGLIGKDPVAQEMDDSSNAKRYGLSRVEYLGRRKRMLETCLKLINIKDKSFENCHEKIMTQP